MDVRCNTWSDCPHEGCDHYSQHGEFGECRLVLCESAGHRVCCNPAAPTCCAMEAHTCYFCDHTGTDVNRIAVVMPPKEYCCDDAVACDHRWQEG